MRDKFSFLGCGGRGWSPKGWTDRPESLARLYTTEMAVHERILSRMHIETCIGNYERSRRGFSARLRDHKQQ